MRASGAARRVTGRSQTQRRGQGTAGPAANHFDSTDLTASSPRIPSHSNAQPRSRPVKINLHQLEIATNHFKTEPFLIVSPALSKPCSAVPLSAGRFPYCTGQPGLSQSPRLGCANLSSQSPPHAFGVAGRGGNNCNAFPSTEIK